MWVEPSKYQHHGSYEYYRKKYCSPACRYRDISIRSKGKSFSREHRRKLSETRKRLFAEGKIQQWSKGGLSLERILSYTERIRGIKLNRQDIILVENLRGRPSHAEAERLVLKKLGELGYRCIDLSKRPLPDAIAIKDGKVFGVEVEHCYVNTKKYSEVRQYDDILWAIFGRSKKAPAWILKNSDLIPKEQERG